jgi:hypothetical protein
MVPLSIAAQLREYIRIRYWTASIHGFGLRFRGEGGISEQGGRGVGVKIIACFLARIGAVREPHLEAKILKKC